MKKYNPLWYEIIFFVKEDIVTASVDFEEGETSNDVDVGWRPGW